MSRDFEPWNNMPSENKAPKTEPAYDYLKHRHADQVRTTIKLLVLAALILLGILWHHGWRP
jgi:hypothetical protein